MRVVRRFQCNPFIIFRSYLELSFSFSFTCHITIVFSSIFLFCSYFQLSLVAVICISFRFVSFHFILLINGAFETHLSCPPKRPCTVTTLSFTVSVTLLQLYLYAHHLIVREYNLYTTYNELQYEEELLTVVERIFANFLALSRGFDGVSLSLIWISFISPNSLIHIDTNRHCLLLINKSPPSERRVQSSVHDLQA